MSFGAWHVRAAVADLGGVKGPLSTASRPEPWRSEPASNRQHWPKTSRRSTFSGDEFRGVVGRSKGKPITLWKTEVSNVLRDNGKVEFSLKDFGGDTPAEQYALTYKA